MAAEAALSKAIAAALTAALNEQPVPTVADVARRLGYVTVKPLTSRFGELSMALRARRRRVPPQKKFGHQVSERVRREFTEALGEFPPPSCSEVVRRLAGHRTQIREDFPDLWRALRERYWQHVRQVHRAQREAFAGQVYQAVMELHRQGVYPTFRLVLAAIPHPQFRTWEIVAETLRLACKDLSIKPYGDSTGIKGSSNHRSSLSLGDEQEEGSNESRAPIHRAFIACSPCVDHNIDSSCLNGNGRLCGN